MVHSDACWDLCSTTFRGFDSATHPLHFYWKCWRFIFWDEVSARAYWTYAGDWCRVLCLKQLDWMVLDLAIKTYSPHRLSVLGMVWHSIFSLLSVVSLKCWFTWHWQEKNTFQWNIRFALVLGKSEMFCQIQLVRFL